MKDEQDIVAYEAGGITLHVVMRDGRQRVLLAPLARALGVRAGKRRGLDHEMRTRCAIEDIELLGERQPAIPVNRLDLYLRRVGAETGAIAPVALGRARSLRHALRGAVMRPKRGQETDAPQRPRYVSNVGVPCVFGDPC